ncbi:MAG: serine--tRNA ligase [Candidatus Daviesbacteria bacterium]|nr:MAG: serine--tRNA ligase [Candidatus Daviesbacteria bacterium]
MLDINFVRNNPEKVKKGVESKGVDPTLVDQLLKYYSIWTEKLKIYDELRHKRNEIAKRKELSEEGRVLKDKIKKAEEENFKAWEAYRKTELQIPNIPLEDVPQGDETKNKVLRQIGITPEIATPKDHVELGELLDIIDISRATKISGTRFSYLKNEGVILELALVQYAMEALVKEGFTPVIPPVLIKKDITEGLGYWHGGGNENYYFVRDFELEGDEKGQPLDLYLIGTGEHSIVPMHMDETLEKDELPKRYAAFSTCFRREAGSYGKDTRGILRVHQFDKVEMVQFVKPEDDQNARRKMLTITEGLVKTLGLPYQVVQLASSDLGFPSAETIDIETWIPSQGRYRETHSISTTTDFQSRRLNIKYQDGAEKKFVHILNGTAFAIGRMIIAILENFQQEDGSVKIPEVLQKYTGFAEIRPK